MRARTVVETDISELVGTLRALNPVIQLSRLYALAGAMSIAGMFFMAGFASRNNAQAWWWDWLAPVALTAGTLFFSLTVFAWKSLRPRLLLWLIIISSAPAASIVAVVGLVGWSLAARDSSSAPELFVAGLVTYVCGIAPVVVALVAPLLLAWRRISLLDETQLQVLRDWPDLHSPGAFARELFGVWPGLKLGALQAAFSFISIQAANASRWTAVLTLYAGGTTAWFAVWAGAYFSAPSIDGTLGVLLLTLVSFLLAGAAVLAVRAGAAILHSAGRYFARRRLDEQVKRDTRPTTVFLRSFADDRVRLGGRGFLGIWRRLIDERPHTLDYLLVENFSRHGPVVALGRPGDRGLPFGAARKYVTHERWQDEVRTLIGQSGRTIVIADSTPGLAWEIHLVLTNTPHELLVLAPPSLQDLRQCPSMSEWLGDVAPKSGDLGDRPVFALIMRNEICQLIVGRHTSPEAYDVALRLFFRRLQGVISVRPRAKFEHLRACLGAAVGGAIVVLCVGSSLSLASFAESAGLELSSTGVTLGYLVQWIVSCALGAISASWIAGVAMRPAQLAARGPQSER